MKSTGNYRENLSKIWVRFSRKSKIQKIRLGWGARALLVKFRASLRHVFMFIKCGMKDEEKLYNEDGNLMIAN